MKLNPDCIRSVMLAIEESWDLETDEQGNICMDGIEMESLCEVLPDFDPKDVFYCLFNLDQAGYLDLSVTWADGGVLCYCTVNYMTFAGHEFLNRIRDNKNWSKVKKSLHAIRNYSLDAISSVSEGVANAAIATALKEIDL